MPLYFFDTFENGTHIVDDHGHDCVSHEEVRLEAMRVLPSIAREEIPKDGDRQAFTVLVKDEAGAPVYSATLTFAGLWLGGNGTE
ncbi:hypothetical protein NGM99_12605 [Mesorhizobium sp. RP14(2022)]|uniref:DUF6894 domain-containing protein n=1 Tax=Mesorhizobium liriopis TaxID=2953882 RepID=A0ABT1C722_9HYPH|nr:hypothetical protein [Mesorhizobium liriopis]MCO6050624.1 hypothetical protein [Mesorhizobium liriopis]